jgi:hypothetical protein
MYVAENNGPERNEVGGVNFFFFFLESTTQNNAVVVVLINGSFQGSKK